MLIDTHAHFYLPQFQDRWPELVQAMDEIGLNKVLLPNIDRSTIPDLKKLVGFRSEMMKPMMGLHPTSVKQHWRQELESIRQELFRNTDQYIAVGEIGIDLHWDQTFKDEQIEVFSTQIDWAKQLNLPIAIHVRNSFDEVFEVIDEKNDDSLRGVFHCFTGDEKQAIRIIEFGGFYLGIGGVLTFKNSDLREVIGPIDMKHLVLETDSPYLAPMPFRGKENQPAYVRLVAEKMAEVKGISLAEVEQATTKNAIKLFGLGDE